MKLLTERLILRDITEKDAKDIVRNINNLNVSKNLLVVPYPYSMKDAKKWIKHCKKDAKKKPRESYELGIELKSEKRIIGGIGLSKVNRYQGTAMIGYWLGENYWRKGYMHEATQKILDFAFNKLKLRRLDVEAFAENEGSNSLIKKLCFRYEGTMIKRLRSKADGKIHDENKYGLLREDYLKRNLKHHAYSKQT